MSKDEFHITVLEQRLIQCGIDENTIDDFRTSIYSLAYEEGYGDGIRDGQEY